MPVDEWPGAGEILAFGEAPWPSSRMAGRRKLRPIRKDGAGRLAFAAGVAFAGIAAGGILGSFAVGDRLGPSSPAVASYSDLSGNPDALAVDPIIPEPCCTIIDSAPRLRASADRMAPAFRDLGSVAHDEPQVGREAGATRGDYVFGGAFDPPEEAPAGDDTADAGSGRPSGSLDASLAAEAE